MIIFLSGPDDYRREERKRFYVAEFIKRHPQAPVAQFDLEEPEHIPRFAEFMRGQSLFDPFRLGILRNAFVGGDGAKDVLASLKEDKKAAMLLSESGRAPKGLSFLEKPPVVFKKFEYLEGSAWKKFITEAAADFGLSFEPEALAVVAKAYEKDTWRCVTELAKIAGLRERNISSRLLEQLGVEAAPFYWGLVQGVKGADLRGRLASLHRLFAMGEPPAKLFNMLGSMWSQKTPLFARGDMLVKTGKLDYDEVLADLVMS